LGTGAVDDAWKTHAGIALVEDGSAAGRRVLGDIIRNPGDTKTDPS
jgi:hypothetical protein